MSERAPFRLAADQVAQLTTLLAGDGPRMLQLETERGRFTVKLAPDPAQSGRVAEGPGGLDCIVSAKTVGEFLTTHPHHGAPLARLGDRLAPGDLLGLIRIGLLLTPVTFDVAGRSGGIMAELLAEDGALVDFATPLFRLTVP